MKSKNHILIVDDVTTNLKCLGEILKDYYSLSMAKSGEQAIQMMLKVKPDLVLLDVKMPGMDGYDTFKRIKEIPEICNIPVIFLTADTENDSELKGLRLGANDYIKKPYEPEVMLERVERVLRQEDINRLMREKAQKDALTGLFNRGYLEQKIEALSPSSNTGSFLILDLDNFKTINDKYGHVTGDKALTLFAQTLQSFVHEDDYVSRIGGDEFAIFLLNAYGKELLSQRIENLIDEVEKNLSFVSNEDAHNSVSVGIASYPFDGTSFTELYNKADKALYYVKRNGKSNFHFYDSEDSNFFSGDVNGDSFDIADLEGLLSEKNMSEGPIEIDYSNFKSLFWFLKRLSFRIDTSIQLLMLSVKNLSAEKSGPDCENEKIMAVLEGAIHESLRKNDISTRFSTNSYLIILIGLSNEDRRAVIERIVENFDYRINDSNILLKYDVVDMKNTEEGDD